MSACSIDPKESRALKFKVQCVTRNKLPKREIKFPHPKKIIIIYKKYEYINSFYFIIREYYIGTSKISHI